MCGVFVVVFVCGWLEGSSIVKFGVDFFVCVVVFGVVVVSVVVGWGVGVVVLGVVGVGWEDVVVEGFEWDYLVGCDGGFFGEGG